MYHLTLRFTSLARFGHKREEVARRNFILKEGWFMPIVIPIGVALVQWCLPGWSKSLLHMSAQHQSDKFPLLLLQ